MMKELGLSYNEVMREIAWGKLLRMMTDAPRQIYIKGSKDGNGSNSQPPKKNIHVTEENSHELLKFIDGINKKTKK